MVHNNELALLFSGGTDSTYTATLMSKEYSRIHLITYDRLGFKNTENSKSVAQGLKEKFGEDKFTHRIINIDALFKKIAYNNYIRDVVKHRFFVLLICGLCKLAMHWQTIIYCLDNNIKHVCDGSNQEMIDPSQDEEILKYMKDLYREFGIEYFNPVYCASQEIREKTIFDLGLALVQHTKKTRFSWERQPFCTQEYIFLKLYSYAYFSWDNKNKEIVPSGKAAYRSRMLAYHCKKRNFIRKQVREYLKKKCA